ncbi:YciI family protein [Burkholderia sp. 22PA0099]|uniref:YciI family protein n=1 Tax=Burkholderia sp. 22PA0099 TaxID=3237372 RepID=UPI0039C272FE
MPYVIETWDRPNSFPLRLEARPEHLDYLAKHASFLLACGAKLNDDGKDLGGGLYVVDTEERDVAQAFIEADPFYKVGLFEKINMTRWRKAYVDGICFLG